MVSNARVPEMFERCTLVVLESENMTCFSCFFGVLFPLKMVKPSLDSIFFT